MNRGAAVKAALATLVAVAAARCLACSADSADSTPTTTGGNGGQVAGVGGTSSGTSGKAGSGSKAGSSGSAAGNTAGSGQAGTTPAGNGGNAGNGLDLANTSTGGYMNLPEGTYTPPCGPGCRAVLGVAHWNGAVDLHSYSGDLAAAAVAGRRSAAVADRKGGPTRIYGNHPGKNPAVLNAAIGPTTLVYRVYWVEDQHSEIWAFDRETGAGKILKKSDGAAFQGIAVDETYAYVTTSAGMFRLNLADGKQESVPGAASCLMGTILNKQYICVDSDIGRIWGVDLAKLDVFELGPTQKPAFQTYGGCSQSGSHCAWTDYRDPPGENASHGSYVGGEVYVRDMSAGVVERLTFDSPSSPRRKAFAVADADTAVWAEESIQVTKPSFNLYVDRTARLDRKTGKKCVYKDWTVAYPYLVGRKLVGSFGFVDGSSWIVELDLDHPDIPWVCE